MRVALLIAVAGLVACGPSKPRYTFPGCEDAGSQFSNSSCDGTEIFACAQRTILERFNTCNVSSDCALVLPRTCSFACQVAVNAAEAGAYRDEIANESSRFCDGNCRIGPGGGGACAFAQGAACDAGRCVPTRFADGG
jgi:hypothetical protein